MKPILNLLSVVFFACCAVRASDTNDVGRYQLFSGPLDQADSAGRSHTSTALYRIDTVTGQTWMYTRWLIQGTQKPDGQFAEAWAPMGEDFQVSLYVATGIAKGWQEAHSSFTNLFASTNALREATDRMYWPPKRREEYDAIVAEAAIERYLATNRPPEIVRPPAAKKKETE